MYNIAPMVSVVTACFNDGPYIIECVESVQKSNYPNIEHIIVDDGSSQSTKDILARINYKNVYIYYKENGGVCSARNLALTKSKGKYILPLDGDDLISPDFIKNAVDIFELRQNVRLVTSEISQMFGCGDGQIIVRTPIDMGLLLSRNLFTVSTLVKREDALLVGGFDEDFKNGLEDWNFWISILKLGGHAEIVPGTHFYYRIKRRHRNNKFSDEENREVLKLIWEKHKSLFSLYYADPYNTFAYQSLKAYKDASLMSVLNIKIRQLIKNSFIGRILENRLGQ